MVTTKTQVANLALDLLGEPYLTDMDNIVTNTGTTADAVRVHFDPVFEQVLEGHIWSFSTKTATLEKSVTSAGTSKNLATATASGDTVTVTTSTAHGLVVGSYVTIAGIANTTGVTPNGVRLVTAVASTTSFTFAVVGASGTLTPHLGAVTFGTTVYPINTITWAANVLTITLGNTAHTLVATNSITISGVLYAAGVDPNGVRSVASVGSGPNFALAISLTSGNSTPGNYTFVRATAVGPIVYATPLNPNWLSSYELPSTCLRLIRVIGDDRDIPENLFEIEQRQLLLMDEFSDDLPIIQYISNDIPVSKWSSTFVEAVALLLASKICVKLTQDVALMASLVQRHEMALGKARSKDSKETRSNENRTARQLAARSELVRARYSRSIIPPY
jgi:hypothetical protein